MISVVIPVFNGESFIGAALRSVLNQTLRPDQIIVVDDGSTDRSADTAAAFAPATQILRQERQGAAAATNRGIAEAKGEFLAFLDADDLWEPEKLARQRKALESDPLLDAVFGGVVQFVDLDCQISEPREIQDYSRVFEGVHKSAMLIRRSAFDRIGSFDEGMLADSVEWYSRALSIGIKTRLLPEVVAFRRVHRGNSTAIQRQAFHRNYLEVARRLAAGRRSD